MLTHLYSNQGFKNVTLVKKDMKKKKATHYAWPLKAWCPEPESNQRHVDFQSTALPTELPRHGFFKWRPGRDLNPRSPP